MACELYMHQPGRSPLRLANFAAKITGDQVVDDGAEERRYFQIKARLNGRCSQFQVSADEFETMRWVRRNLGAAAIMTPGVNTRQHLAAAIQSHSLRSIVERHSYAHTGWRNIVGELLYLHAGGAIGKNGHVAGVDVTLDNGRLKDYVLPVSPTGDPLHHAVRTSLGFLRVAPPRITVPMLAAACRAPLGEFAAIDFSVFLAGPTSAQKTELSALVQGYWGAAFNGRNLPGNWSSTANSLERQAFQAKDAVFTVDDFAPAGSAADVQRFHLSADRLLRAQGNRAGRGRMGSDGRLLPEYFPRGLIISSGEDIPRGHSLRARMLIIEVARGDVDLKRLSELQAAASAGTLAQAMSAYLQWVAAHFDTLKRSLPARQLELRTKVRAEATIHHDRTPDIAATLALGWETFLQFAEESGAVSAEERAMYWCESWEALKDAAAKQHGHHAPTRPSVRFLELIRAAISSHKAHVAGPDGQEPTGAGQAWGWDGYGASHGMRIGWVDGDDLYLEPETSHAVAQQLAHSQGEPLTLTPQVLRKRLKEDGLLKSTDESRGVLTQRKTLEGARREVLHVEASSVIEVS